MLECFRFSNNTQQNRVFLSKILRKWVKNKRITDNIKAAFSRHVFWEALKLHLWCCEGSGFKRISNEWVHGSNAFCAVVVFQPLTSQYSPIILSLSFTCHFEAPLTHLFHMFMNIYVTSFTCVTNQIFYLIWCESLKVVDSSLKGNKLIHLLCKFKYVTRSAKRGL